MLQEEAESFSQVHETGNAEGLQMNINLTYPTPVQKNNTAVPRPLYPEVKQYVEDLLNRGWFGGNVQPILHQLVVCGKGTEHFGYVSIIDC